MSRTSAFSNSLRALVTKVLVGVAVAWTAELHPRPVQAADGKPARLVQFELAEEYEHGILPAGQRVGLTIRLLAESEHLLPSNVVAIVEVPQAGPRLVSLANTENPSVLEALASIELPALDNHGSPRDGSSTGVPPGQLVRVNVTFARLRGMTLQGLFKRRLYLAIGPKTSLSHPPEPAPPGEVHIDAASLTAVTEEDPPAVPGVMDEVITEVDLLDGSFSSQVVGEYWRDVGRRLRHRWVHRDQTMMPEHLVRGPRIHFRLYPGGVLQMIYVERSSGNSRVDIAGLESILETHSFSPFPTELREPYVNVHVQFRGERRTLRE